MEPTTNELVTLKNNLKLREKKLDDQLDAVTDHIARLEEDNNRVSEKQQQLCDKLKEIEKHLNAVKEREKELNLSHDRKMRELESREEMFNKKHEALIELANEKKRELVEFGNDFLVMVQPAMGSLDSMRGTLEERINEFENWKSVACVSLSAKLKEAESIQELVEKRFEQLEIMERKFDSFQEEKKRDLVFEEQRLESSEARVSERFKVLEAQELCLTEALSKVAELRKESTNRRG